MATRKARVRAVDLRFQEFGLWQVLGRVPGQPEMWLCQCACGQATQELHQDALLEGGARSCGCDRRPWRRHDLSGQRYGALVVLRDAGRQQRGNRSYQMYLCRCMCGTEKMLRHGNLLAGTTTSCGCQQHAWQQRLKVHRWYGKWFVLGEAAAVSSSRKRSFLCRCLCGRERRIAGSALLRGASTSCRCRGNVVIGQRFGRLTVLKPSDQAHPGKKRSWLCACVCGRQVAVLHVNLRSGRTASCGCLERERSAERLSARRGALNHRSRRLIVDGTVYATLTDAARHYDMHVSSVRYWLKSGRAQYVGSEVGKGVQVVEGKAPAQTASTA